MPSPEEQARQNIDALPQQRRANLGRQAMAAVTDAKQRPGFPVTDAKQWPGFPFQQFVTPDGRKFTELYNVQHLTSNKLDRVCRVTICTFQRLYPMLRKVFFWVETRMPQGVINTRRQVMRCA